MIAKLYRSSKKGSCAWRWWSGVSAVVCVFIVAGILSNKSFFANQFRLLRGYLYVQHTMLVIHTSSCIFRAFWCSLYLFSWWLLTFCWPNKFTWSSGDRVSYYQTRQSCPASNYARLVFLQRSRKTKQESHTYASVLKRIGAAIYRALQCPRNV